MNECQTHLHQSKTTFTGAQPSKSEMQPPLPSLLLCLLLACLSQAFVVVTPPRPHLQRCRPTPVLGLPSTTIPAAAAGADNDWPSDSSDMEDTSEDPETAGGRPSTFVDVEARKATIQVRVVDCVWKACVCLGGPDHLKHAPHF